MIVFVSCCALIYFTARDEECRWSMLGRQTVPKDELSSRWGSPALGTFSVVRHAANWWFNGVIQADIDEFAKKIRACKETQSDPDFSVVARVEGLPHDVHRVFMGLTPSSPGFIAGWPLEEVLKRSHAYVDAGADAILMHRCDIIA